MVPLVLFGLRIALVALLYLLLIYVIRTGIGLAQGSRKGKKVGTFELSIIEGPKTLVGTRFTINTVLLIGRAPGNDIQVSDGLISGSHARLTPVASGAVLEDLGSTNGTLLNGMPIHTAMTLRPGDRIEAGSLKMVVELS